MPIRTDFPPVFRGVALTIVGTPVVGQDITGWTLQFIVGPPNQPAYPARLPPLLLLDNAGIGGVSIPNGPAGEWQASITSAQSLALAAVGTFPWSIWRVDAGFEDCLAYGNLPIQPTNKW